MRNIGNFETSVKHYECRYDWIEFNFLTTLKIFKRIQFECVYTHNAYFMEFIAKEDRKWIKKNFVAEFHVLKMYSKLDMKQSVRQFYFFFMKMKQNRCALLQRDVQCALMCLNMATKRWNAVINFMVIIILCLF